MNKIKPNTPRPNRSTLSASINFSNYSFVDFLDYMEMIYSSGNEKRNECTMTFHLAPIILQITILIWSYIPLTELSTGKKSEKMKTITSEKNGAKKNSRSRSDENLFSQLHIHYSVSSNWENFSSKTIIQSRITTDDTPS